MSILVWAGSGTVRAASIGDVMTAKELRLAQPTELTSFWMMPLISVNKPTVDRFAILGFLAFIYYKQHKYRETKIDNAIEKGLKITEYKGNVSLEAVQDVMSKLANPETKGSTKTNLQRQLKDLDIDGTIQSGSADGPPGMSPTVDTKETSETYRMVMPKRSSLASTMSRWRKPNRSKS